MTNQAPFPIISTEGEPYEIGCQYGEQAKHAIRGSVNHYRSVFEKQAKLQWDLALDLAKTLITSIEEFDADAVEEMRGIAKGAGRTFEEIVLVNARSELLRIATAEGGTKGAGEKLAKGVTEEECSTFAITPEASKNGHTLIGQNWDMDAAVQKQAVIVKKKKKGKPNCVTLVEAGMLGKQGFNSAGMANVGNGLFMTTMKAGVPIQFLMNKLLSAESLVEAIGFLLTAKRASATNRVIASHDGQAIDIELAPEAYNVIYPESGIILHTNHFLVPNTNIKDNGPILHPNTLTRIFRLRQLVYPERGNITIEFIQKVLRDHVNKPDSLCRHIDPKSTKQSQTNATTIYDLDDKTLCIAKGPPCENEFVTLNFEDVLF